MKMFSTTMFTGGMKEEGMTTIPLHGISACTLAVLIEFAYTAEVRVNEMNVCYLLPAATMFQMNHVVSDNEQHKVVLLTYMHVFLNRVAPIVSQHQKLQIHIEYLVHHVL
jgi:hypothetical protein